MSEYIYIARNDMFPHLVKIGFTTRNVHVRLAELNGTGVPGTTTAVYYASTLDARYLEQLTHKRLEKRRESKNREFFRISAADARETIRDVAEKASLPLLKQWSDDSVNEEDTLVQMRYLQENLEKQRMAYDYYLERSVRSNPFKRHERITASEKLKEVQKDILLCEMLLEEYKAELKKIRSW